jgi:divalent metal cation (Fe/Co/Zn/Cd) transporter
MSLADAHRLAEEVEDKIREAFRGVTIITHIEPATEEEMVTDDTVPGIRKDPPPADPGSI